MKQNIVYTDFTSRNSRLKIRKIDVSAVLCYSFALLAVSYMFAETVYALTN